MPLNTALRSIIAYSLAVSVVLLSGGCGKPNASRSTSAAPPLLQQQVKPPSKQRTIGVSLWRTDDPWRAQMKADIEAAAAKHPELALVFKDAKDSVEQQRADIEQLLADRVALLIVSPVNAQSLTDPVAKVFDAGIPVIVVDRAVVGDKYTCLIQPDDRQIGAAAGRWLAGKLGGKGKIAAIKGPVDSTPSQQRYDAFCAALRDPGYRFVYEASIDPPRADASALMKEALERTEQIDAVYACTDESAQEAYETAKSQGREKGTLFLGIGGLPTDGLKYVSEGGIDASLLHPTCGVEAIDAAQKLLAGQKVPKTIHLGTRLFTKDNMAQGGEAINEIK